MDPFLWVLVTSSQVFVAAADCIWYDVFDCIVRVLITQFYEKIIIRVINVRPLTCTYRMSHCAFIKGRYSLSAGLHNHHPDQISI